jgi:predicted NACHT family NTPase
MNSFFYLERNLTYDDRTYTEEELLATSKYIVVLAEPGGGKTELMKSLARKLSTTALSASLFAYTEVDKKISH